MNYRLEWQVKEKTFIKKYANDRKRHVTVFLEREGVPTGFHCVYCKKKLMEHQQNVCMLAPGLPPDEVKHIEIKCPNPNCKTYYYFVSAV